MTEDFGEQDEAWEVLYEQICELLQRFGTEDLATTADCWVDDDNIGTKQQKIYVGNLNLLRPYVVKSLQELLSDFPD